MIELTPSEISLLDDLVSRRLRVIPSEIHHTSVHEFRDDLEREFALLEDLSRKFAEDARLWPASEQRTRMGVRRNGEYSAWGS